MGEKIEYSAHMSRVMRDISEELREKEELEAEQGEGGRHDAAHGPAPEPGELPPERAPEEQG